MASLKKRLILKIHNDSQHFFYHHIRRNMVEYAKSLGVQLGGDSYNFIDDPMDIFGSEPWLIHLGNHVRITHGVRILTHEGAIWTARGIDNKLKNYSTYQPVYIGNNVTIGMYSIIMPGIHIGNNVIIGAHSVVTKDIPDDVVYAGVPARRISDLNLFMKKSSSREMFDILDLSSNEKRDYLKKIHPEWFV